MKRPRGNAQQLCHSGRISFFVDQQLDAGGIWRQCSIDANCPAVTQLPCCTYSFVMISSEEEEQMENS